MKKWFRLPFRKWLNTGAIILTFVGITTWLYRTAFADIDAILRASYFHHFVPALKDIEGAGLLLLVPTAIVIGAIYNIPIFKKTLNGLLKKLPVVSSIVLTAEEIKDLPLVEFEFPSSSGKILSRAFLRSVEWDDRPTEGGERESFIQCTILYITANNPTSGWLVFTEPEVVKYVMTDPDNDDGNPSGKYLRQTLSCSIYNPRLRKDRLFDPNEFLGKELASPKLAEKLQKVGDGEFTIREK